ncbi:MAG: trypsin-like peptidase domain-containing protein [Balneolales bacterium]
MNIKHLHTDQYYWLTIVLWISVLVSCSGAGREFYGESIQKPGSGNYLTGFPYRDAGLYLETMMKSVKRITSTSYYTTYFFSNEDRIRIEDISSSDQLDVLSRGQTETTSSKAGSAIIIHNRNNKIALITTAHTITSPDTLYEYYSSDSIYLQSISVRSNQVNWLYDAQFMGIFEVLAIDPIADLAVIGTGIDDLELQDSMKKDFPVIPYPLGNSENLRSGAFVYLLGYPRGYQTVTSGIVSQPNRDRYGSFVTDVLFNPGFSGGLFVAIDGGIPAFEWIGIARSASVSRAWVLKPDEEKATKQASQFPYEDEIYAVQESYIDYGITHAISTQRISSFLRQYRIVLINNGYNLDFWNP